MEETLDPISVGAATSRGAQPAAIASMQVLLHADLRRIEDEYRFGPAHVDSAPVTLGRDLPDFFTSSGHPTGSLRDPCISRKQVSVRYLASPPRFEVSVPSDARRPVRFFTAAGAPLEPVASCVPVGSLMAIGDRVLLALGVYVPSPFRATFDMVGASAEVCALRREVHALANETSTVMVRGETGTGKELVARALHSASARRDEPFVAVNCAAIPEALFDSELFGFEKGAFSGAASASLGLFREAGRGTIFLDEVGELSMAAQPKLLRVLQERRVRPVGSAREHPVAARVVVATHRPLERDVEEGRFRADLLARVELPCIRVKPLRERRIDIPILFAHFLLRAATDSGSLATLLRAPNAEAPPLPMALVLTLMGRPWAKNIRELEKLATVAELSLRTTGHWPALPAHAPPLPAEGEAIAPPRPAPPKGRARPGAEELVLLLDRQEFVQRRVAEELGVSRTTLDKWMREHGIRRPSDITVAELERAQHDHGGDPARVAAALRISVRGLKQRLRELRPHAHDE